MRDGRPREVRFYNLMLPLWLLILFPMAWLAVLPANFVIDSAVLLIALRVMKVDDLWQVYRHSILRVWLLGFASDFVGVAFLLASQLVEPGDTPFHEWWYEHMTNRIAFDPFSGVFAFAYVLAATALSALCIYWLNRRFSFRKTELDDRQRRRLALVLALCTAPYLFFFPSRLLHGF